MSTHNDIEPGADIIDVRDIIARVEELREERDNLQSAAQDEDGSDTVDAAQALREWEEGREAEELATLESLLGELCGQGGDEQWQGDWYPITLIHESHFETAMDELLEDIDDLPKNLPCYLSITVDYDALKMDYSGVEYSGHTYLYR